jgi:1-acyl-sn-glycerol-3-phosphate acyltransferase
MGPTTHWVEKRARPVGGLPARLILTGWTGPGTRGAFRAAHRARSPIVAPGLGLVHASLSRADRVAHGASNCAECPRMYLAQGACAWVRNAR